MESRPFLPAKHSPLLIKMAQTVLQVYLQQWNRVHISLEDLETLRSIPQGHGALLTPNHSDEVDPLLIFDLFRRSNQAFSLMCNREAFDEYFGFSGWLLQRIGYFSVERGSSDAPAKRYSVETIKNAADTLVIFPEGEIFYLNDQVQTLHTGAIEIGMQAIIENRKTKPDWTAYIIPTAIKYRYSQPMESILQKRVAKMEKHLAQTTNGQALRARLSKIQAELLEQEEQAHHIDTQTKRFADLNERITFVRQAMLSDVEKKYKDSYRAQASTIDQTFELSAHLRKELAETKTAEHIAEYTDDLATLKEVEELVSWRPQYVDENTSIERMAEMVTKLERELYRIKRPHQLGKRNVFIKVGKPIDLGELLLEYQNDPHLVRHNTAELLRDEIQALIDKMSVEST
ncbi:MAG: 1-acyl-sn-glycerol-3-phosphate acyltransferase [Candidatus Obscuribacterales bacterium]|nr:1-acyl-sn-glycerol-3-phosphate acyltransferase [Candidatus Obscuribacterales bacterium]